MAKHRLGDIRQARYTDDGVGEFVYLRGPSAGTRGDFVSYSMSDGTSQLLSAGAIGPVGVLMADVGSGYGWVQVSGMAVGKVPVGFTATPAVYVSVTPGVVDDSVVSGDRLKNCTANTAEGTPEFFMAEFDLTRPWVDGGLA